VLSDFRLGSVEGGQAILVFLIMLTVFLAIAAIVFDLGLWVSERRGAVKDADAAVFAGVQALVNDPADLIGARDDAAEWAQLNGIPTAKIDPGRQSGCSPDNSCINADSTGCDSVRPEAPWIEAKIRHEGKALFSSSFGVTGPDVGSLARACVGSPTGYSGLTPFAIETEFAAPPNGPAETGTQCQNNLDDDASGPDGVVDDGCPLSDCMEPNVPANPNEMRVAYGSVCVLREPNAAGLSGRLNLISNGCSQNGGGNMEHEFHYSSAGTCYVGSQVDIASGNSNDLFAGLAQRLDDEIDNGLCDARFGDNDDFDDFAEVFSIVGSDPSEIIVPSATGNVFADNDCAIDCGPAPLLGCPGDISSHRHHYLPRALDLVLVNRLQPSSGTATITGFTRFYLIGCYPAADAEATKQFIGEPIPVRYDEALNRCDTLTGDDVVIGVPIRSLAPAIEVKNPNRNLPLSIILVK